MIHIFMACKRSRFRKDRGTSPNPHSGDSGYIFLRKYQISRRRLANDLSFVLMG
jgi:hypothetical protein